VTPGNWWRLVGICNKGVFAKALREGASRWFVGAAPPGTAYEAVNRLRLLEIKDRAVVTSLHQIAPFDAKLAHRAASGLGTPSEVDAAFGRLIEYDLSVMKRRTLLALGDVDEYRRRFAPICDLDAASCTELGDYLVGRSREDEAAIAYRRAADEALDPVPISHKVPWLVDYYVKKSQEHEAFLVARRAAETYSETGLLTMARLLERLDRYREAEHYFCERARTYDDDPEGWAGVAPVRDPASRRPSAASRVKSLLESRPALHLPE
jgi:tetratricopeptide (TPR) repeat protein